MSKLQLCVIILIINAYLAQISNIDPFSNYNKLNRYEKEDIFNIAKNNKKTFELDQVHLRILGNKNKNLKNSKTSPSKSADVNKSAKPDKNANTPTNSNDNSKANKKDNIVNKDGVDQNMNNNNNKNDSKIKLFIVLLILILIVVIALLIVIIVLMCKKKRLSKLSKYIRRK